MKLKEIVKQYLEENYFAGLCNPGNCGCDKNDLFPCEMPSEDCEAALFKPCYDCDCENFCSKEESQDGCYIIPEKYKERKCQ